MKFKYVGTEPVNLAGVGTVKPGDVITVSDVFGKNLQANDDQFILQPEAPAAKPVVAAVKADVKA